MGLIRRFEQGERDYPRPAPAMQIDHQWRGCIKVSENGWEYSDQFFPTEEAAMRWAVETVEDMINGQ